MEPMTMLAIGAVAAPVVGGIVGNIMGRGDRKRAAAAAAAAYQELLAVGVPPDLSKEIIHKEFQKIGIYDPEIEQEINLGVSKVEQLQEDPAMRDAQTSALQLLQQRGRGLGPEERAAFNQIRSEVQRDAEAKRQQILQSFQQRGMGGAGAELAAQLTAAQGDVNEASAQGDRLAATSAANALQAIAQAGQLGGQIRGQDFDVNRTRAAAADEFQRFNVENQIARQQRNVASRNEAQMLNLSEQQRVADMNTQMLNAERDRQAQAKRDFWSDQMAQAQARANARLGQANMYQQQADRTAGMWQGIGSGVGTGMGAAANAYAARAKQPVQTQEQPYSYDESSYRNRYADKPSAF